MTQHHHVGWAIGNLTELPPLFEGDTTHLWQLFGSTVVNLLGSALCAGAGIGGGAFYLSAFIIIMGASVKIAVPLSKVTIFGSAVASYLVNWKHRHPKVERPLIDYDVALIMEPMTLMGTTIGVILNVTFPQYIILILLIFLLLFIFYKTFKKGVEMRQKETQVEPVEDNAQVLQKIDFSSTHNDNVENEVVKQIRSEEARSIHYGKFLALVVVQTVMLVIIFLAGGGHQASVIGIACDSWQHHLLLGSAFVFLILFTVGVAIYLSNMYDKKVANNYLFTEGDLQWSRKTLTIFPTLSIVAGVAAGFLGIGGGMVAGPIMLEMGMIPMVATATSSYQILFTASATTFQYLFLGVLNFEYALWFLTVGFLGALIGQSVLAYLIKKYKKQYFVTFLVAFTVLISLIILIVISVLEISSGKRNPWKFTPYCPSH